MVSQHTLYDVPRRTDDALWKALLENVFDDFLRFSFPTPTKFEDFTFLDKELADLFPYAED